nr:hypothetical protein CFP56_05171 [Quercus suber]
MGIGMAVMEKKRVEILRSVETFGMGGRECEYEEVWNGGGRSQPGRTSLLTILASSYIVDEDVKTGKRFRFGNASRTWPPPPPHPPPSLSLSIKRQA